jgi:thioredoxin-like negative regulator of GroEL
MLNRDRSDQKVVEVVLVTAPRCHFCDDASRLLEDLGGLYSLTVREVKLESDEGIAIATRFRVPFPPVILLNGAYFGHGRISRRKLTKTLNANVGMEVSK